MVFNVLVGNLRMCSIPTGKHVRAQGLFSVRVATPSAGYRLECCPCAVYVGHRLV